MHIINELYEILQARKTADPEKSYVAGLYKKGTKQIARKLGEEATELVIEALCLDMRPDTVKHKDNVKAETADLLFHTLVLLAQYDIHPDEILEILSERLGISGLDEKAARKEKD